MIYLASPYSHADPTIAEKRVRETEKAVATLLSRGTFAWSPIIQTYNVCKFHELPTDVDFWKGYNFDFMRRADAMYLLQLEGWEESKGLKMEVGFCHYVGLPLRYIHESDDYHTSQRPYQDA